MKNNRLVLGKRTGQVDSSSVLETVVNGILIGTASGCRIFEDNGNEELELEGRSVSSLTAEPRVALRRTEPH